MKCNNIHCGKETLLFHNGMKIYLCSDCAESFNHCKNFVLLDNAH